MSDALDLPLHDKMKEIPDWLREAIQRFVDGPYELARWGCPHGVTERFVSWDIWMGDPHLGWECPASSDCRFGQVRPRLWPTRLSGRALMHEITGIDYDEFMAEKDALLETIRNA